MAIAFDLFRRNEDNIYGVMDAVQIQVNITGQTTGVVATRLDYQEIHVAVRSHITPRG